MSGEVPGKEQEMVDPSMHPEMVGASDDQGLTPQQVDQGYDGSGRQIDWPDHWSYDFDDNEMYKNDRVVALDVALHYLNATENPKHFQTRDRAQADLDYYNRLPADAKRLVDQCAAEIKADKSGRSYAEISRKLEKQ